ncbi:MAG TPA: GNAT family N-acetyltransferase [Acidimicrobiales bacterium]|nr:GNAT family N-acetyltransferase [Acidimicrobiales bacterium]
MIGQLALRPMQPADLVLVERWLGEPHVARWYLVGSTVARELDDLRRCVAGTEPTHALVVVEAGRPIGWCQWYRCDDYPDHAVAVGAEPGDIGIDYAVGEPDRVGRGVGTALVRALVDRMTAEVPGAGMVADPDAANLGSRRVLEKAGFRLVREGPVASEPTDDVMAVYRRPPVSP